MLLELLNQDWSFGDKVIIFLTFLVATIISLAAHELAHAWIAVKCGDPTPKTQGRLTLNPLAHIDPMGFMSFLLLGFGWAKPVAVNTFNFRNYKRDTLLVSIAGVITNLILAFVFMPFVLLVLMKGYALPMTLYKILIFLFEFFVATNVVLLVFNLFPIYPLDGFRAISSYLRYENPFVVFMKKYGSIILIGLLIIFDIVYAVWDISIMNYICYYVSWPFTQFWSWVFGCGNFNLLGFYIFGVI